MVDVLSHGRLEAGFVRGVPYEVLPANSNPVRMNERQWEALDLIVKAWTTHDGPFSHEGRFFHYRAVNIWPRCYQQPHPPIWISTTSPSGAARVGAHGYVQATFLTGFDGTRAIFDAYRGGWREAGRGNDVPAHRLAYAALVYTAPNEADARAGAEKLLWYITSNKVPPHFANPPGYVPVPANVAMLRGAEHPLSAFRQKAATRRGRDRSRHHVRRHAGSGVSADEEALRPRRRVRAPADHGPGRLPRARRDGPRHPHLRPRTLSAAQGGIP